MNTHGTPARTPRPWRELHEDVTWLVRAGTSVAEICRRLDVTVDAVQRAYYRHQVPVPEPFRGRAPHRIAS